MEIIKPRTLSGFMELLPDKQIRFEDYEYPGTGSVKRW